MKKHISIFLVLAAVATVCWSAAPKGYNRTVVTDEGAQTDIIGEVKIFESLTSTSESFSIKGGTATLTQIKFGDGTTMETAATGSGDGVDLADVISATSTWTARQTFGSNLLIATNPLFKSYMALYLSNSAEHDDAWIFQSHTSYGSGLEMFKGDGTPGIYIATDGTVGVGYAGNATGTSYTSIDPTVKLDVAGNVKATAYYGDGSNLTGVSTGEFLVSPSTGIIAGQIADDVKITTGNITATGDSGYLNKDGTWSTPETASVAASAITAGTMDSDVVAQTLADSVNYSIPASSISVAQITTDKIVTSGSVGSIMGDITEISTVTYARINTIEFEDGTTMTTAATGSGEGDLKADGTVPMTGDLNMGGQDITNVGSVLASEIVVTQKTDPTKLYFYEGSGGGENKITLKSSATLAGDFTLTLPNADGTADQVIATDGAGNLYFKADATGAAGVTYEQLDSNGDVGTSAGQLAIGNHTHSYQAADDDLTDLADGTLTGSKVGTGIVAANIASGSMGSGVIVSSMSDTAFTGYTGQVVSNTRKVIDTYDYAVTISTPFALGTNAYCISPFRSYAVTITTISAVCSDGTNMVFMIEKRPVTAPNAAGADIWSGDVTALTTWTGGTAASGGFSVAADTALYLVPTSVSGDVDSLVIKYRISRD